MAVDHPTKECGEVHWGCDAVGCDETFCDAVYAERTYCPDHEKTWLTLQAGLIPDDTVLEVIVEGVDHWDDNIIFELEMHHDAHLELRHLRWKAVCSSRFVQHPECKLYRWVKALGGDWLDIEVGSMIQVADLLGMGCYAEIGLREADDGYENYIRDLLPEGSPPREIEFIYPYDTTEMVDGLREVAEELRSDDGDEPTGEDAGPLQPPQAEAARPTGDLQEEGSASEGAER